MIEGDAIPLCSALSALFQASWRHPHGGRRRGGVDFSLPRFTRGNEGPGALVREMPIETDGHACALQG